jgi:maleate cis-trans isomerase
VPTAGGVSGPSNYERLLDLGYGWRARIGFLSPGLVDETISRQFYRMAPDGVTMVRTSLGVGAVTPDEIRGALARAEDAARELAKERPDCIILGGSPTVVIGGIGSDELLTARVTEVTGIPASAAQTAAVEAMRAMGVTRLCVASPFPEPFNTMLEDFLTKSGITVVGFEVLDVDYRGLTRAPLRAGYETAKRSFARAHNPDGLYFPAGPFPVADIIEPLESELGVAVISSMQATLWKGLRLCGVTDVVINGYGRLLRQLDA